jgi:hypothetical protein
VQDNRLTGKARPGIIAFYCPRFTMDRAISGFDSSVQVMAAWMGLFLFMPSVFGLRRVEGRKRSSMRIPFPTLIGKSRLPGRGSVTRNLGYPLPFSFAGRDKTTLLERFYPDRWIDA